MSGTSGPLGPRNKQQVASAFHKSLKCEQGSHFDPDRSQR